MCRNLSSVTSPLLDFSYKETLPPSLTMFFVVCVVLLVLGLLAFLALWVLDSFSLLYPSLSSSPATSSWRQMTNTEGTNQEQEISLESVKSCDSGLPSYEEAIEKYWDSREKKEKKIEANKRQLNDKMDWNIEQASDIGKQGNLVQVKISALIQICISLVFLFICNDMETKICIFYIETSLFCKQERSYTIWQEEVVVVEFWKVFRSEAK